RSRMTRSIESAPAAIASASIPRDARVTVYPSRSRARESGSAMAESSSTRSSRVTRSILRRCRQRLPGTGIRRAVPHHHRCGAPGGIPGAPGTRSQAQIQGHGAVPPHLSDTDLADPVELDLLPLGERETAGEGLLDGVTRLGIDQHRAG